MVAKRKIKKINFIFSWSSKTKHTHRIRRSFVLHCFMCNACLDEITLKMIVTHVIPWVLLQIKIGFYADKSIISKRYFCWPGTR